MLSKEGIAELKERLTTLRKATERFFEKVEGRQTQDLKYRDIWVELLTEELLQEGEGLRDAMKQLSIDIAGAARSSPLIDAADLQDLRQSTRRILAGIHFRQYRHWGVQVHNDEDRVLGIDPPSQDEIPLKQVAHAREFFSTAATVIAELIDLLSPAETTQPVASGTSTYRPNTAFVMMAIDKGKPELQDIKNSIKDVCKEFGIAAVTADDIEHDGAITDRILEEIETNEFLIADLTAERPNVYYEVGHAHARDKRVILYRKTGTKVHFDIAHRNVPEYESFTDLKEQLRKRLESVTNKPQKK